MCCFEWVPLRRKLPRNTFRYLNSSDMALWVEPPSAPAVAWTSYWCCTGSQSYCTCRFGTIWKRELHRHRKLWGMRDLTNSALQPLSSLQEYHLPAWKRHHWLLERLITQDTSTTTTRSISTCLQPSKCWQTVIISFDSSKWMNRLLDKEILRPTAIH